MTAKNINAKTWALTPSADGRRHSAYPSGNAIAASNAQMSFAAISGSTVENNTTLLINANGSISFGDPAIVFYRDTLESETAGATYTGAGKIGTGTVTFGSAGAPKVVSAVAAPYGKAISAGLNGSSYGQIAVFGDRTNKVFEHVVMYYPSGNQDALLALDPLPAGPQTKPVWHMDGPNGYGADKTNFFHGHGVFNVGGVGGAWTSGPLLASNSIPSVYADYGVAYSLRDPAYPANNRLRSTPVLMQMYADLGTVAGGSSDTEFSYSQMLPGISHLATMKRPYGELPGLVLSEETAQIGITGFTFPGYVSGLSNADGTNILFCDLYVAHGENAAARVEICDTEDYSSRTKVSPCDVVRSPSGQLRWSTTQIMCKVKSGVFLSESLAGKWIHIHNGQNELVASIQIPGGV